MANKIDSNISPYQPVNGHNATAKARGDAHSSSAARGDVTSGGTDTIHLTDSARQMMALEAAVASASEVDMGRVEALRAQIDSGNYDVAPQAMADNMLRLDQALPAAR